MKTVTPTVVPMGMTESLVRMVDVVGIDMTSETLVGYARTLFSMKLLYLTPEEDAAVRLLSARCNAAVKQIQREHNV